MANIPVIALEAVPLAGYLRPSIDTIRLWFN
jgi:hypothetical protein